MDVHSALMALLSEVARLPLICFLHHPSGVALVHVAQEEPLHMCLTASREGREGGLVMSGEGDWMKTGFLQI